MTDTQLKSATKFKFTKTALAAVVCPPDKKKFRVTDTEASGLTMLVTDKGARSFYYYKWVGGRPIEERIAGADEITPDQARAIVQKKNGQVAANIDPRQEKRAAKEATTLGDLWTTYRTAVTKAPRTMQEDAGLWNRYLQPWSTRRLTDITDELTQKLYNKIAAGEMGREAEDRFGRKRPIKGGPSAANKAIKLLREMFGACAKALPNPAKGIRRETEQACERYVTADEFPAFWTALTAQGELIQDVLKMALYTAQRRSTLFAMEWGEVNLNFKTWTIPAEKMKMGKAHTVPLVLQAMEILERRRKAAAEGDVYVFASRGEEGRIANPEKAIARINAAAKLNPPISLHDLRRTTATWANSMGATEATVAGFLAQKHRNVTGIYAKATADTMRKALENAVTAMLTAASQNGQGRSQKKEYEPASA